MHFFMIAYFCLSYFHTPWTFQDAFMSENECDDYVCMIMWPAECVCCNTPPKSGASAVHRRDESGTHCSAVFGQSIRWPHDNPRFLRHARKPVPVHIIMHSTPLCSTNCQLMWCTLPSTSEASIGGSGGNCLQFCARLTLHPQNNEHHLAKIITQDGKKMVHIRTSVQSHARREKYSLFWYTDCWVWYCL